MTSPLPPFRLRTVAIAVALAALPAGSAAAPAYVNRVTGGGIINGTSSGSTLGQPVTAGNSLIVAITMDAVNGAVTCSDTQGNSYQLDLDTGGNGSTDGVRVLVFSAHDVEAMAAGSDAIIASHPQATRAMAVYQFSGLVVVDPVDQTATHRNDVRSSAMSVGPTGATNAMDELVFAVFGVETSSSEPITPGPGHIGLQGFATPSGAAEVNVAVAAQYRLASTGGPEAATATLSTDRRWAAGIVTYRSVGGTPCSLEILEDAAENAQVGVPYPYNLEGRVRTTGESGAVTFASCGGSEPGFQVDTATGAITWTPATTGTANLCVQAGDSCRTVTYHFDIEVAPEDSGGLPGGGGSGGSGSGGGTPIPAPAPKKPLAGFSCGTAATGWTAILLMMAMLALRRRPVPVRYRSPQRSLARRMPK
jgi:hypothetical protein